MTSPQAEWNLDTRRLGRRVLVFERVDSTNTVAAALGDDLANDGLAVLADEQSAGRGQHGRTWVAPPRSGVLLSVLLWPPPPLYRPVVLTAWAAVAACAVVRDLTGAAPRIKWPNDVLVGGLKVCGILIEQGRAGATVVGIGLNVAQSAAELAQTGLVQATSLAQLSAVGPGTHAVAVQLLHQLDADYDRLCGGDLDTLEVAWRAGLRLLDREVVAECADGPHAGRLRALSFDRVELGRPGEGPLVVRPEAVLHLEPAGAKIGF